MINENETYNTEFCNTSNYAFMYVRLLYLKKTERKKYQREGQKGRNKEERERDS
jgi:hypothetical protein